MVKATLETKYCELSSMKMAYTEHGEGIPLLLVHPNSSSKKIWEGMQKGLFKGFHTYAVDLRCHGESESEQEELTYTMSGQDVLEFCHKMNLTGCKVLGYSDGAIIGMYLGMMEPESFDKIISISPNIYGHVIRPSWLRMMKFMLWVTKLLNKIGLVKKRNVLRTAMMLHEEYIDKRKLTIVTDQLLVIYGENDICYASHFEELKALMPDANFIEVPGATHISIMKNELTIESIRDFFEM